MGCDLLKGVTIVAASVAEAGPAATQILGLLGADIFHIERPTDAADPRYAGFIIKNSNKKDITLNTKDEKGKEILWQLIEKADVFFENFAPGAWDKMGFSYEEVRKRNPRIVYATLKGFSNTKSQWRRCVAYDPIGTNAGGHTFVSGYEDMDPMMAGINIGDSGTALNAAMEISLAILRQRVTGEGMYLECPMQNAATCFSRAQFAEYWATGSVRRSGNSYKGMKIAAPHGVYPAMGEDPSGNYVSISCTAEDSSDFFALCKAMGRDDLAALPQYQTAESRFENRFALDAEIRKWTMRHTKFEVLDILAGQYKVPCGAVMSQHDLYNDPYVSTHILTDMADKYLPEGFVRFPTVPIVVNGERPEAFTCGKPGDGNEEVYMGILGMSKEEFDELKAKKII